jgi:hypothetical protein
MSAKFEPDERQRFQVAVMIKCGFTLEETAREIGVDVKTMKRACKTEIKEAKRIFLARVEMKLSQKALAGDTVAMLFIMKCQAHWHETSRHEVTGADGKALPMPSFNISFEDGGPGRGQPVDKAITGQPEHFPPTEFIPAEQQPALDPPPARLRPPIEPSSSTSTWERLAMTPEEFEKVSPPTEHELDAVLRHQRPPRIQT